LFISTGVFGEDSLGHWRKRENRGKYRENLRSKEHKD